MEVELKNKQSDNIGLQFKALSCKTRRNILATILEEPKDAGKISKSLLLVKYDMKKHLKILVDCNLVVPLRKGNIPYYRTNYTELNNLSEIIIKLKEKRQHE